MLTILFWTMVTLTVLMIVTRGTVRNAAAFVFVIVFLLLVNNVLNGGCV